MTTNNARILFEVRITESLFAACSECATAPDLGSAPACVSCAHPVARISSAISRAGRLEQRQRERRQRYSFSRAASFPVRNDSILLPAFWANRSSTSVPISLAPFSYLES